MGKLKNDSISNFLLTFFVGDQAVSRLLSDVLENRKNRLFLETLGLPLDFTIPFYQEETMVVYSSKHSVDDKYEVLLNGQPCNHHVIHSGDYFTFKNRGNGKIVRILFITTSDIRVSYKKYKLPKDTNVYIGRTPLNDISCDITDYISREKHAAIRIDGNGNAFIEDLKRSVGIYVNGRRTHSQRLELFDEVFIMGLSIVYLGDFIAVRHLKTDSTLSSMTAFSVKAPVDDTDRRKYFVSTPRILKSLDVDEIEVDAPPNPSTTDKTPAILTLGPSLTMSLVMLVSMGISVVNAINGGELSTIVASGTMAVGMLLGSLLWPALLRNYQKRRALADESYRKTRFEAYISKIENELIAKRDRTIRVLNDSLCPSPEFLCSMLDNETNKLRLWERSAEDDDFLSIRMGLGSRPFDVRIKIPKQGFQLYEDELRRLPIALAEKYGVLDNVPLTLNIQNNRTIGLIGSQNNIGVILNEIILNIIALHSYDEVKLVIVTTPKQVCNFENYKNVPHIWSNDKKTRFLATTSDEVHYIFNIIDDAIKEREAARGENHVPLPHYVVVVTDPDLIEKEALLRYMNDADNRVGITTLFSYGDISSLPKSCKTIIQSDETRTGYYIKNRNENKFIPFVLDPIDTKLIHSFTNKLSQLHIKRDSRSLSIVDRISFLQMYRAGNVDELDIESRWDDNNSAKSLAAPIGVMAGGEVFKLDLHEAYHGCHGLVAGTTGSGKSEFLQAFILSLAINYSPEEIAFVLVDFKGGDMARPFMAKHFAPALPHLAATISNLSGNILYRALVSFEAEIKSRQRIFNEAAAELGVDKLDINAYHKYYKAGRLEQPLPHLVIIIDEFAQLKTQQPEFLTQLINVAQVGRSLGIHLILATQKPSGIVDPQIVSNSRFKVCLKVAEKQDSVDMINKPDAALIKNPGRLYLQVGYDEIYECIQSGYSGADYVPTKTYIPDEEITVHMTDNTANPIHSAKVNLFGEKSEKTQLETIVAHIVALGQRKGLAAKPLWRDMLPEKILVHTLKKGKRGICTATIGMADYVRTQEQESVTIDFAKIGHVGLYGASGTGKTTFLQTLVYSMVCEYGYTPEELNIYAMDFGGRNLGYLSDLPHTGGVVFADDEGKIFELTAMLQGIIEERKRILADNKCATFADCRAVSKKLLPAILVMIDNYASFHDKYMDISDSFIEIISSGKTLGVYFVITGNTTNSIYYKVKEHISTYFTLKMNDPSNYQDIHNVRPLVIPEEVSGRGITVVNKEIVEFQTAIVCDGESGADRMKYVGEKYRQIAISWNGSMPPGLDHAVNDDQIVSEPIAVRYTPTSRSNTPEPVFEDADNLVLGTSKTGALTYGIMLAEEYKVCVCANDIKRLGEFYRILLTNMTQYGNRRTVFIDDDYGTFRDFVGECPLYRYISGTSELDSFIEELKPELNSRLETSAKRHDQLFIVVSEFNRFFNMITDEQAVFMRKVFQHIDDPQYRICFVCGFDVNGNKNNDRLYMSMVVGAENYVLCPNTYELASAKIETLPLIMDVKSNSSYFCLREKNVEIRW